MSGILCFKYLLLCVEIVAEEATPAPASIIPYIIIAVIAVILLLIILVAIVIVCIYLKKKAKPADSSVPYWCKEEKTHTNGAGDSKYSVKRESVEMKVSTKTFH